jgi:hypothetical protein
MGLLSILNKKDFKEFINFINKDKAKVHVKCLAQNGVDFKEITDISEKPAIVSLITNMALLLKSKKVRRVGFNVSDILDIQRYFANAVGVGNEFLELEDKYGATMVTTDDGKPSIFETEWIDTEDFNPKMADASHLEKIQSLQAEDEYLFYLFMKVDGHDKKQPVLLSWKKDNVELFHSKFQELLKGIDKLSSHKLHMTLKPMGNKNAYITSVKAF